MTERTTNSEQAWRVGRTLALTLDTPRLMGVLNVTPDSFSDGGLYVDGLQAVEYAIQIIEQGAAIIDIGGESTRPGACRVDPSEQLQRVLPVIVQLRSRDPNVPISIDTTRGEVAKAAIEAGANIINDVAAGTEDESILDLAAKTGVGLVLMHRVRPPDADVYSHEYRSAPITGNVVDDVRAFLGERAETAIARGVSRDQIVLDPGLGFGKTVAQNFKLIARMDELLSLGFPVLGAASRKSFLGKVAGIESPAERDGVSVAAAIAMFERGVRLFRVHEVAMHRQALAIATAVRTAIEPIQAETG